MNYNWKRIVAAFLAPIWLLTTFASAYGDGFEAKSSLNLENFLGQDVTALTARWGAPDRTFTTNDGLPILRYEAGHVIGGRERKSASNVLNKSELIRLPRAVTFSVNDQGKISYSFWSEEHEEEGFPWGWFWGGVIIGLACLVSYTIYTLQDLDFSGLS